MRLENYITHGEYLDTIELAYKVKKICMVAARKAGTIETFGLGVYIDYSIFLSQCSDHIFHMRSMDSLFNIRRKYTNHETFFGIPVKYIYDFNVLELDEFLTKPTNIKFKKPLKSWGH